MHPHHPMIRFALPLAAGLLLSACGGAAGPGWTFAPLGPSAPPATPTSQPTAAPSGDALVIEVKTTQADPLVFEPALIEVPPATLVTVNYLNDSSIQHNINFFDGPDQNSPSLGKTEVVTGPAALESVTFTTPDAAGDYYFWCDVHFASMAGTWRVTE